MEASANTNEIPKTMKAWQWHTYGEPKDVLKQEEIPVPEPDANQVLVKVLFAAVNPVDWTRLTGHAAIMKWMDVSFPRGIGTDMSGVVVKVGAKVTNLKVGDEIIAKPSYFVKHGTLAEYTICAAELATIKPKQISADEGAATGSVTNTSIQALRNYAQIKSGDSIFINGGASATGQAAIQLAKNYFGAKSIATTCSTKNIEMVKSLGADHVFDYKAGDVSGQVKAANLNGTFDIYYDCVGDAWEMAQDILKPGTAGTFVTIQPKSYSVFGLMGMMISRKIGAWFGGHNWYTLVLTDSKEDVLLTAKLLEENKVRTRIHKVYDYKDLPQALEDMHAGICSGKAVIKINP